MLDTVQKITLTTEDDIKIIGNYYPAKREDAPVVVLLHMMPSTKEGWNNFIPLLQESGFQVLAIDERGHGESTQGGKLNYRDFSDEQQQAKKLDVLAARNFFENKGISTRNIFVGGGSIGANLAIQYMAENSECRAGFALSAGYNYKGIETTPLIKKLNSKQAIYIVAAKDDTRSVGLADEMAYALYNNTSAQKEIKIFETGGHAEDIFKEHPDFMQELANWMAKFI